jgi:hypothetical protein
MTGQAFANPVLVREAWGNFDRQSRVRWTPRGEFQPSGRARLACMPGFGHTHRRPLPISCVSAWRYRFVEKLFVHL